MGRTISDEDIKLNVIINGNVAQKQLIDLEAATRKATEENKQLKLELGRVEKSLGKNSQEYQDLSQKIKLNTSIIENNKATMRELQKQIGVTGLTMNQLGKEAGLLRLKLSNAVPGTEAYAKYKSELALISSRMDELKGKANATGSSISSLADKFNKYQALAFSVIAGLTGVVLSVQKVIDINGKLSDSQADVMKTTGMNKDEVDELTKSFGLLETRTNRIDLLKIAEQGGRLGVPKAEIQDFVREMNVAAVALGDSFTGGVDEVAEKLGKIKFLFKETKDADIATSYQAIGSAINDLGANGVASEANIAEFTKRIGSLTDVLKPTVQETLALGAAFEESGIEAETSSRAYNIFMKQASTESAKFAKVMGISKQAVEEMINTNPLEFMLNFSKGLNGMNATEVANTLDYLGVNADGANKVIGAMGNNFDRFHELIDLSNKSFDEGTSLITEYNVKNENLAATLEKIGKKVNGWFSSEGFNNWLFGMVNGFAKLIGATDDADGSSKKWRETLVFTAKIIAIVISAMVTNVAWQKLVALWTNRNTEASILYNIAAKARAFADGVVMVSSQLLAGVTMLLTGNIKGAIQAFRVMTATMMTTPWGFILGAIAAIGAAYVIFSDSAKEAATAQSVMAENSKKISALVETESNSFLGLLAIINDTTASTEARTAALERAKEIGGEYTEGLTLENAATFEGKKMIDAYIKSLERKLTLQVLEAKSKEILAKIQDKKNQSLEEEVGYWDELWSLTRNFGNANLASADVMVTATSRKTKALKELQDELKFTNAQMKDFLIANPDVIKNIDNGSNNKGGGFTSITPEEKEKKSKKDPNSTQEEINKLYLENNQHYVDEMLKQERQLEDDRISLMLDGYEKDLAIEALRYERRIDDLNSKKVHIDEIAKLDADASKALEAGDLTKYSALLNIKNTWIDRNKNLDAQVDQIKEGEAKIHFQKLATIEDKAATENLKKRKEQFDADKILRETDFQKRLLALGNNEKAKARLKKEFELSELAHEEEFLKELIEKFNTIIGKGELDKIDLSLLTPEQVAEFEKEAAKVGLALRKIQNEKNALASKNSSANAEELGISNGSVDIFGFSPSQWDILFSNLKSGEEGINSMVFAVAALTNAYSQYSDFLTANENAQLKRNQANTDKKKQNLKKQLDAGYINQVQYNRGIEKVDKDLEKQKAEIDYKQAKRQKIIAAANILSSTAQAIIGIWAQVPKFDLGISAGILTGVVSAIGALQLATVLKTPLPAKGYEQGLYPDHVKREQDGKVFKSNGRQNMTSGLFSKPTILVGEGPEDMPEMVIDKKAYSKISPNVKAMLINELRGIKGFENGYYDNVKNRIEIPVNSGNSGNSGNDELLKMLMIMIAENTATLKDLQENPLLALVSNKDYKSMKNLKEGLKDYETLIEKTKR